MSKARSRSWKAKHPPRRRVLGKRHVYLVADVKGYYDFTVFDFFSGRQLGYAENGVFYKDLYGRDCVCKLVDIFIVRTIDTSVFGTSDGDYLL